MRKIIILQLLILSLFSTGFSKDRVCMHTYKDIVPLVQELGFTVTATTNGRHNVGSKHPLGKAVDVRTRDKTDDEVASFMEKLRAEGYFVLDERVKPKGRVWSGAHVHIHILPCRETVPVPVFYEEPEEIMCTTEPDYSILEF